MSRKVKVGVFGVGSLGQHHARIYGELEQAELVGVFDIDARRAADIAAKVGAQPFSDVAALAAAVDAASVVVPTDKHFEMFNQLLAHNVHMMMEKPIAARTDEAERMVEAAQAANLVLQVGHIERFNPVMKFMEDRLGQPRFIEATRLAPYPPPRDGAPPRGTEVSVVLDLMIHDLDIILHLVRRPVQSIHAVGVPVLSPSEDIANVRLGFEGGCVANVTASRISQDRLRKVRVFQADAYLSLDYQEQSGQIHTRTATGIDVAAVPVEKGDALTAELGSFLECVVRRDTPVVSGEQGTDALRLAVEICHHIENSPS